MISQQISNNLSRKASLEGEGKARNGPVAERAAQPRPSAAGPVSGVRDQGAAFARMTNATKWFHEQCLLRLCPGPTCPGALQDEIRRQKGRNTLDRDLHIDPGIAIHISLHKPARNAKLTGNPAKARIADESKG